MAPPHSEPLSVPLYPTLQQAIEALCAAPHVTIARHTSVGGGCIGDTSLITVDSAGSENHRPRSTQFFMKRHSSSALLRAESVGLIMLRGIQNGARYPQPLAMVEAPEKQEGSALLLEAIEPAPRRSGYWRDLGRALAHQHRAPSPNNLFGFQEDNFIGSTPQINSWHADWPAFFAEHRLAPQIELARNRHLADTAMVRGVERIMQNIASLLRSAPPPAILHGDLWSGNVMTDETGGGVLIDPAIYWGDCEADLAMTELFGRFSSEFYAGYHEINPIDTGYPHRRDLYNLYHILNHLNLFGSGYASHARTLIKQFS